MKNKSLKHLGHYLALLFLMICGILAIVMVGKSSSVQTTILITISLGYFIWGIIHQLIEREFSLGILIEYFLMSLLGFALVLGVLRYI